MTSEIFLHGLIDKGSLEFNELEWGTLTIEGKDEVSNSDKHSLERWGIDWDYNWKTKTYTIVIPPSILVMLGIDSEPEKTFIFDEFIDVVGTCLQGRLSCSFRELWNTFGDPISTEDSKTQVEWRLQFNDGTIATIYDYKEGEIPVDQISRWSVGGFTKKAYGLVLREVEKFNEREENWA